jgi:hypothetical protein
MVQCLHFLDQVRDRTRFIKFKLGLGRKQYMLTLVNLWHKVARK